MPTVYIALGSNIGDRAENLRRASVLLAHRPLGGQVRPQMNQCPTHVRRGPLVMFDDRDKSENQEPSFLSKRWIYRRFDPYAIRHRVARIVAIDFSSGLAKGPF